jgi:hydrogenase nickel incorporation protein HypB
VKLAEENRKLLEKHRIVAIDILGSVGSGKTTLIDQMVRRLKRKYRVAVFNGDLTTTIDSDILRKHGISVVQINTGKECHLDANLVRKALSKVRLEDIDLLFIENVGNLICPAEFPLGSDKRVAVISVTEGPYMVVKHPYTFMNVDVVVINKIDLASAMNVNVAKLESEVRTINPNAKVVKASCKTGERIPEVVTALNL